MNPVEKRSAALKLFDCIEDQQCVAQCLAQYETAKVSCYGNFFSDHSEL